MPRKSELVDVEVEIHHETKLAYLVSLDGDRSKAVWVPDSVAEVEKRPGSRIASLTLPQALAEEKGLV